MTVQSNSRSHLDVSAYAENVLGERLQTIPGVSSLQIWGQKKYAMRLYLDPAKMQANQISFQQLRDALNRENVELPGGKIAGYKTELSVKTPGRLATPAQFNQLIVSENNGSVVRLQDIGEALLGSENEETILKSSGIPMIGLALIPQPGANYLDIADEFYKRLDQIKATIPEDIKVDIALDNTLFIKQSVLEVQETLLIAIVLVVLIIYLFFRDWLIAFRPLVDIPVSLIGAFFIMYLMDYSINVLTLLAIVLATGLVVDDGIVVTENIYKKIEAGMPPIQAAIKGSNEILFAVVSTSVTLAAVFLPVIFLEGFVGRLFREFGVVLAGAVLISAFVSLTLTPMLNARMVRKNPKKSRFYLATEPFFESMNAWYQRNLIQFLKNKWNAISIIILSLILMVVTFPFLKSELAPIEDRSWVRLSMSTPEGTSYEATEEYVDQIVQFVMDSVPEHKLHLAVVAPGFSGSGAVNTGFLRIVFTSPAERDRTQMQLADYIGAVSKRFPNGKSFVIQQQTISAGGFAGLPIQYVIQAPNFEELSKVLPVFVEEAGKNPSFLAVDVNLKFNKPELNIQINRNKAAEMGVSVVDIAQALQLAYSNTRLSYFTLDGKQYQVIGQVKRDQRNDPSDLKALTVKSKTGNTIPLESLVEIEETASPPQLYHYNRYQSATVSAALAPGKTIAEGIKAMDDISKKVLNENFSTTLTGASRDYAESSSNIYFAFILALLLVYLILAAQFESFIDPFVVMLTVPLALAGAVFSLWYFNQTFNIFSQIGMIMLIGLVTKNGILIVEFANQLQEKGLSKAEAILEASVARFRPILMTSLATALGALPIALSIGAAAKSRMGMGIVVVGGLMFSLMLTLFVIPSMYKLWSRTKKQEIHE
jgi:multidrug efflux pump